MDLSVGEWAQSRPTGGPQDTEGLSDIVGLKVRMMIESNLMFLFVGVLGGGSGGASPNESKLEKVLSDDICYKCVMCVCEVVFVTLCLSLCENQEKPRSKKRFFFFFFFRICYLSCENLFLRY